MKISKERFKELGLGVSKECCKSCDSCHKEEDKLVCEQDKNMNIEKAEKEHLIAPCLDEERIKLEMTEEEYDAYRHNNLDVEI